MAELTIEIQGSRGEISANTFKDTIFNSVSLLSEFDAAISGKRRGYLRWYVNKLSSEEALLISFVSHFKSPKHRPLAPELGGSVTKSFVNGFEDLERRCVTPAYLSEFGLERASKLVGVIGKNGAKGLRFSALDRVVEVSKKTSENIEKLLPIRRRAIGSVEGKLEAINLHRQPRVVVYHAVTHRAITCLFDPERFMGEVLRAIGRRVVVFGQLQKNIVGDTLRVEMLQLKIVDDRSRFHIPEVGTMHDPDFADTGSTAEYLRRIRGAG